ncbi:barstar family protein [Dyella sp.]|uniref:barstar family protein n=1 Tax=Dyella sp. TaxID=1869338 RepID=UPI002ED12B40
MSISFDIDLHDAARDGVFFATQDDIAALDAAARQTSLRIVRVDLHDCTDKDSVMRHLNDALHFPAGFGANWDALTDCLRDLSWLAAPGYLILLMHGQTLREANEEVFDTLLDVLDEAAEHWFDAKIPFFAFLALPESALDEIDA